MYSILANLSRERRQLEPLHRQIYQRLKEAIIQGTLAPNSRLPSLRGLASDLGVARATVENAYSALIAEGFLQSRGQAGTYVSAQLTKASILSATAAKKPTAAVPATAFYSSESSRPFQLGLPALDMFPRALWQRLVTRRLRASTAASLSLPALNGLFELREAIAHYLHVSRSIVCSPEQIFICAGYPTALDMILKTLLQPGDAVWHEDPGYPVTSSLLTLSGMQPVPVAVDEQGMNIAAGIAACSNARMAILTPTHQSPLGVSLSLERRLALLDWANSRSSWIVEDDYDSEFRYHGRPLPPLKSIDRQNSVLYIGTFSKALFPALRLAYLVVPDELVTAFEATNRLHVCASPPLIQGSVADFIHQGHFYRHLKRMRVLYRQRREWLAQALEQQLGDFLEVVPQAGGIQLLARLKCALSDIDIAQHAWQRGLAVQALSHWQTTENVEQGLLVGFANFTSIEETERAVSHLAAIVRRLAAS